MKHTRAEEQYKKFVESKPCLISGEDAECHHVRTVYNAGMSMKPQHFWGLPLARRHHRRLHDIGERRFWDENCIDPNRKIIKLLSEYIEEQDKKVVPF